MYVAHTSDGDWWVSDGVTDPDDADAHVVSHMSHVVEQDPTVLLLAGLPVGQEATRASPGDEWDVGAFDWAPG